MSEPISAVLGDWRFIRGHTKAFIEKLGKIGLKSELPRPGLNTPAKHFQEMLDVQRCYREAINSGVMSFDVVLENDAYEGQESVETLLEKIEMEDSLLQLAVESAGENVTINWPGEGPKPLLSHLSNLLMHESLHLGQLIAFCYATGLPLPEKVSEEWALSPQKS